MSLWVKICGTTSLEDARVAVEAGADAVGFVFAASPRQVTAEQVAAIVPRLPVAVEKIGVFVGADVEEMAAAAETCGLTGVQLHFAAGRELTARLRARLGPRRRILRVVHYGAGAAKEAAALAEDINMDALLVDARTDAAPGGTGLTFDWEAAGQGLFAEAGGRKLVAAGGLTPENVAEAVRRLRPWGVDAVSGVEAAPGRKDAEKVRAFVAAARAAAGNER